MQTFNENTHTYINNRLGLNANQMTIDQGRTVINQLVQDLDLSQRQLFNAKKELNELKRKHTSTTMENNELKHHRTKEEEANVEKLTKQAETSFLTYIINVSKELDSLRNLSDIEYFSKVTGRLNVLTTDIKNTIQELSRRSQFNKSVIVFSNKEQELLYKIEEFLNDKNAVLKVENYTVNILSIIEELLSIDSTVEVKSTTKQKVEQQTEQKEEKCQCFMHRLQALPKDKLDYFNGILTTRSEPLSIHFEAFVTGKETKEQVNERLGFNVYDTLIFNTMYMMYLHRMMLVNTNDKESKRKFEAIKDYVESIQNRVIVALLKK